MNQDLKSARCLRHYEGSRVGQDKTDSLPKIQKKRPVRANTSFGIRDLSRNERHQKNWVGKADTYCQKEVYLPIRGVNEGRKDIPRAASADVREHAVYKCTADVPNAPWHSRRHKERTAVRLGVESHDIDTVRMGNISVEDASKMRAM